MTACNRSSLPLGLQVSVLMAAAGKHSGGDEWNPDKPVMLFLLKSLSTSVGDDVVQKHV